MVERILVFLKYPEPGRVKTRLAADLGAEEAARFYRGCVECVLEELRTTSYEVTLCYHADWSEQRFRDWLGSDYLYRPQSRGDLGQRLAGAFAAFPDDRCLALGTDCPQLPGKRYGQAFEALKPGRVVIGPSRDGGYYLLGLERPSPELFEDIPWSTDQVLARTLERAEKARRTPLLLAPERDIDQEADLLEVYQDLKFSQSDEMLKKRCLHLFDSLQGVVYTCRDS